jgi:hypothetical protein
MRSLIFALLLVIFFTSLAYAQAPRPEFELAIRGGPAFSAFLPGSVSGLSGWELFHIAPGLYTRIGVFSVFYSQQTDNYSCGPETIYLGNVDWSDLLSCTGKFQEAGSYYRLMSNFGNIHPWVGLGAAWYKRVGYGMRRYHEGETANTPIDYRISTYEEGVFPFLLVGGEYAVSKQVSLGVDFQGGLLRFRLKDSGIKAKGNAEEADLLPSNLSLRVSYKVY